MKAKTCMLRARGRKSGGDIVVCTGRRTRRGTLRHSLRAVGAAADAVGTEAEASAYAARTSW
eukprot:6192174-Pleurochrysis_carterae.AAC.1